MSDSSGDKPRAGRERGPGVRIPPPLLYLGAIALGLALDPLLPLRLLPPVLASWLGGALVLAGVVLDILGVRAFRKARTTVRPDRPASALVTGGPYRFTRNPLYVSLLVIQAGIGIWIGNLWVLLLALPTAAVVKRTAILPEERYLAETFGLAYQEYRDAVPRWL